MTPAPLPAAGEGEQSLDSILANEPQRALVAEGGQAAAAAPNGTAAGATQHVSRETLGYLGTVSSSIPEQAPWRLRHEGSLTSKAHPSPAQTPSPEEVTEFPFETLELQEAISAFAAQVAGAWYS